MTDAPAAVIPSPCIGLCRLDGAGICTGCGRVIDEIAAWPSADAAARLRIRARAAERRPSRTDSTE